jgi:hypothetical protein
MALLNAVLDLMRHEYKKKEPSWTTIPFVSQTDLAYLEEECNQPSDFDQLGLRKKMFQRFKAGTARYEVRQCEYGQVMAIYDDKEQRVPWGLWGRILRSYHERGSKQARVFLLAHPALREFPKIKSKSITPENINGGYTYHCNKQTIMLYRAEDATRVLIHELQHASCLDHTDSGVDHTEAETEAWAELLYAGFLSMGNAPLFHRLIKKQSDWMQTQNAVVQRHLKKPMDFPWRYTIGKEEVWKRWGILQPASTIKEAQHSLRLTPPPTADLKKVFGSSTIL